MCEADQIRVVSFKTDTGLEVGLDTPINGS